MDQIVCLVSFAVMKFMFQKNKQKIPKKKRKNQAKSMQAVRMGKKETNNELGWP